MLDNKCPICGVECTFKLSGKGKHYALYCKEHFFVRIIKNPVLLKNKDMS